MDQQYRIEKLEKCDCKKSCTFDKKIIEDGYKWDENCQTYKCVKGVIESGPKECAKLSCKHPHFPNNGSCCPVCLSKFTLLPRCFNFSF